MRGTDTSDWLQGILTSDIREAGGGPQRCLALDRLGKIQGELVVWPDNEVTRLIVVGGEPQHVLEHFRRYIIMEDVELQASEDALYTAHGEPDAELGSTLVEGGRVRIGHCSWFASGDSICIVAPDAETRFRTGLERHSRRIENAASWRQLRVVCGLPTFGVDYDSTDTPGTANLIDELVSQEKGCYLGQEVVCKMLMRGAIREQLTRLWFQALPKVGVEVLPRDDDTPIGRISSAVSVGGPGAWAMGRLKASVVESRGKVLADGIPGQVYPRTSR